MLLLSMVKYGNSRTALTYMASGSPKSIPAHFCLIQHVIAEHVSLLPEKALQKDHQLWCIIHLKSMHNIQLTLSSVCHLCAIQNALHDTFHEDVSRQAC